MVTEKTLAKFGFIKDTNNLQLKEFFKDNINLKEIHMDIYPDNPMLSSAAFMLMSRTVEKNARVSNDKDRLILRRNDVHGMHFMNILFSRIIECFFKTSESCSEFILNIQNIYYRITIFN